MRSWLVRNTHGYFGQQQTLSEAFVSLGRSTKFTCKKLSINSLDNEIINVKVWTGTLSTGYAIHKKLLPADSLLLDAGVKKWSNSIHAAIHLEGVTSAFATYFNWLYNDIIKPEPLTAVFGTPLEGLWDLWLAGEDLGDPIFQNAVMDHITPYFTGKVETEDEIEYFLFPCISSSRIWLAVDKVYRATAKSSMLRKILVDLFFTHVKDFSLFPRPMGSGCEEFLVELVTKFAANRYPAFGAPPTNIYYVSAVQKRDQKREPVVLKPRMKDVFGFKISNAALPTEACKKVKVNLPKGELPKEEPSLDNANHTEPSEKGGEAKVFEFHGVSGSTKASDIAIGKDTEAESCPATSVPFFEKATVTWQFGQVKIGA